MAITVTSRPEKTLSSGYVSRWNASRTPLNYKFSSTKFPVNTFDTPSNTQEVGPYDSSERGMRFVTTTADKYSEGDWVKIENFPLEGVYKIKKKETSNVYFLDLYDEGTYGSLDYPTMSDNRYYKGYKGLAKVFAGAPSYHPYNTDTSKPLTEIGTIEIEFDSSNEGIANVRNFIKPDMTAAFDYNDDNSHFAWTSFAIEYAEIWDGSDAPTFEKDILENCTPFVGFSNENFSNGLTDWDQLTEDFSWIAATSRVRAIGTGGINQRLSNKLKQDISLRANIPYQISLDYTLVSGTVSDNISIIIFVKPVGFSETLAYASYNIQLGADSVTIDYTPTSDIEYLGIQVYAQKAVPSSFEFSLQYFQITSSVLDVCEYSSFSIFGAKQFQDSLGGNFGDYIADSQLQGKFLTHFSELTYPYYVNSIIPNATFNRSEGNDSIFLDEKVFDGQGNTVEEVRTQISNASDGVYTVESGLTSDSWKTGTAQIISIPSNLLLDGDNGTYEDSNTATWNISNIDAIASAISHSTGGPTGGFGIYNANYGSLTAGEYVLYEFDTPIQTIVGEGYTFNTDSLLMNNFAPNLIGNGYFCYRLKGTNIISNKFEFVQFPISEGSFQFDFEATQTSHQIEVILVITDDVLTGGGFSFGVDNTTFKGPIEYLTESKPIKSSSSCSVKYNTPIRWKNDLGGWEQWNFNRYRTFNETVSNRNEIRRDVTQDWDNYFINGDSEYDTINLDVRKSVTLRSGLLTENEQIILNQIRRSIKIQIQLDGVWTTVTTKPSTFLLTDESEYMREVSFEVFLPNTLVQEQ
jgi:hypothetical protein